MNHKVTINQGRVIPVQFRIFGSIIVFMVMAYALTNLSEIPAIIICIVISFLIPLLWSSYYILQIDPKSKTISNGYWIMNLKKMEQQPYDEIEKIYVNEVTSGQRFTSYSGRVSNFKTKEYAAYLKLKNGDKFFLLSDKNEETLSQRLQPIYQKLKINQFSQGY